jgi:hypothetical protein
MRMICPKCRHENPNDAVICEFCGEPFKLQKPPKTSKEHREGGFTIRNLKILSMGIFILFIITVAILWPGNHGSIADNDSYISGHASWQQIAIYNGTSDDLSSFQIKGSKIKVYITAEPLKTDTSLKGEIYSSNGIVSSDDLTWEGRDSSLKAMSLQSRVQPGSYAVNIDIPDTPTYPVKWTVQVFDYY